MRSRARALTPHLFVRDVTAAIAFYRTAFGAVELFRNVLPDGTVLSIELAVGDARLLVSEEVPRLNAGPTQRRRQPGPAPARGRRRGRDHPPHPTDA
ncbi:MAG: hypothetical protein GEV28_01575 [Actinophytocola sp.]|uniref:hypothetical protein n=1 Tax=Actinophytocola sp. TaxID=1872138 RepID=UPI0013267F4A|nr:hypothetical protein [Actinophytocola sp.]MPZ79144.1 hypothetical protein [Actinophytocola sp.]